MQINDDDFSEELDSLSLKTFGHTGWEFHKDTDLNKFVIIFNIKSNNFILFMVIFLTLFFILILLPRTLSINKVLAISSINNVI